MSSKTTKAAAKKISTASSGRTKPRLKQQEQQQWPETRPRPAVAPNDNIQIYVSNVVSAFSTKCSLNLRRIGLEGANVEYERHNPRVIMRLRKPLTTATLFASGKVMCTGANSEADAYTAARRYCRILQKLRFKVKLCNFRVVNVVATCFLPFTLDVAALANENQRHCSYEPELNAGAVYRLKSLHATLIIHNTGSINMTVSSVENAQKAISHIYSILSKYKKEYVLRPSLVDENNNEKVEKAAKEEAKEQVAVVESAVSSVFSDEQLYEAQLDLPLHTYEVDDSYVLNTTTTNNNNNCKDLMKRYPVYSMANESASASMFNENSNSEYLFANNDTMMSATTTSYSASCTNLVFNNQPYWFNENLLIDNIFEDFSA